MREWRIGSAVVVSAIHDASDFDGESPLRIVSTDRFAGMHLHRGILVRYQSNGYWMQMMAYIWTGYLLPIKTIANLELIG